MRASEDFLGVTESITAWVEWALWLGVAAGVLMTVAGWIGVALGRQSENSHLARNSRSLIVTGLALSVGTGFLSGGLRLLTGGADTEPSPDPKPAADSGSDSILPDLLLWGGLALGGLAVAALAGWGAWRVRRRRTTKRRRRQALERTHDTVATAYGDYLGDVLEWLDRPSLSDVSVPETAALVQALAAADDARLGDDVDRYQRAVAALSTAWKAADDRARRTGLRQLPPAERRAAEQARKLLATALDTGGSDHERRSAYARARDLLDGILVVPAQAVAALESTHRLALAPKHL
ncbi:hypothetical protein [Streptomyces candidus]|uniref:Uncharacterized protein n=1 Tax=Streptomyces candidus TaxID=67283 RepID=A0A7X0LSM8_9ACTN|nr:hypothetical protein [Streptomyces candidus]MBB6439425.1 hypothetical protein [Streptomyces candidus]GHH54786.1 hypothetical protein GCM10018773_58320 [Streptomyces candidus]